MARMYARRRGKSGSNRPFNFSQRAAAQVAPEWAGLGLTAEEVETRVVDLYNQGRSTSEIGITLRDSHGVPSVVVRTGKKITKILKERGVVPGSAGTGTGSVSGSGTGSGSELPEDLQNLMRKALKIRRHLEENRKDLHNKRALQLVESKIRRLTKYYTRKKVMPAEWRYKPGAAEFVMMR